MSNRCTDICVWTTIAKMYADNLAAHILSSGAVQRALRGHFLVYKLFEREDI